MYDLVNTYNKGGHNLRAIGEDICHSFNSMRILASGQIVEDIALYNHANELFKIVTTANSRPDDFAEVVGNSWENIADNML